MEPGLCSRAVVATHVNFACSGVSRDDAIERHRALKWWQVPDQQDHSMKLTRREFVISTLISACSSIFVKAEEQHPIGILDSFKWGEREIPISESRSPSNSPIDKAITGAMREYGVVGCGVSAVRGNAIVYAKGFGYAELPTTAFLATTATRCGSLAKPVTALSALILSDQGKLDLDAEVLPILKEAGIVPRPLRGFKMDDRISRIKIRHLMDHTSGLPNETTYTAWRPGLNVAARAPAHYTREPDFNPATSKFYSKGFNVRFSGGQPWFGHSGMTQHCGGVIGSSSGYQYIAVSNWNNAQKPYVDLILGSALKDAVGSLR
jgi:hypothetical protein